MYNVNAAIAGSGFIGPVHVDALKRLGINILGVLEATPDLGQSAAHRMGLSKVYENLEDLLKDDEVQVIHITTPNRLHFEMASASLKASGSSSAIFMLSFCITSAADDTWAGSISPALTSAAAQAG